MSTIKSLHLQKIKYEFREELEVLKSLPLESAAYKAQKKIVENLASKVVKYSTALNKK